MPDRIIRESICTSDTIDKLSWIEEVFWHRLTVNCDDFGRFDARPEVLKGRLFPLKEGKLTLKSVGDALNKLATVGLVTLYVCDGRPYLQLVTWEKYQRKRATKSKYPDPPLFADNCCQTPSNAPVFGNRESGIDIRESGEEQTRKDAFNDFFESIWLLYPNKKGKGQVSDAQKGKLCEVGYERLEKCIARYKSDKPDWQAYQNGSTFFNSGYVDYLDENYQISDKPKNGDRREDGRIYLDGKWVMA